MSTITQISDWDCSQRRVETPVARSTDPVTSHIAAHEITASGVRAEQQAQTVAAVREHPGCTMSELARRTGLDRYMLGRRISECETAGVVFRGLKRRCSVTGRMAEPWYAIDPEMKSAA